jgi:hypothetical protein
MLTLETEPHFETIPLYKYFPCPEGDIKRMERVKQILVEHMLYFASRRDFNDPFDCTVPSFLQLPGTFMKRYAEEFVVKNFSSKSETEQAVLIDKLFSVDALEEIRQGVQGEVDKAGIICFSQVRDDILMWAHYADKHKGLCLEFDGSSNCIFFGEAQPVEYEDYTPIPMHQDRERQMSRVILTKSRHWSYEKEYRIFSPETANKIVSFPAALLTGVIFGCMTPDKIRVSVKQWIKDGNCRVAFFEARPKLAEFGLDIVRIG